jgi:phosphatidylglycerol:prolipoprotein diacylglycerol transferase
VAVTGFVGAKLAAVLDSPSQLLAHPFSTIFSMNGYMWYGGFLAAVATLWLMGKYLRIPSLMLLDLASPCAAMGYAIARLGCLLSGDGDYGIATSLPWGMSFPNGTVPTGEYVHPTPIYECLFGLLIFYYLWRAAANELPHGSITARYLVLTGCARFLVEFIRLNPRTVLGLSSAQIVSVVCIVSGLVMLGYYSHLRRRIVQPLTE